MPWNDYDDSDLERYAHKVGAQVQQRAQGVGSSLDASIQPRLDALRGISNQNAPGGSAAGPGLPANQQAMMQQNPPQMPVSQPSSPNAQMGTMDEMASQRQKMLDMYNQATQDKQNAASEPDTSDYEPFQQLKSKIKSRNPGQG